MHVVVIEFGTSYFCLIVTKEYAQLHIEKSAKPTREKNLRRKSKTEREEMPF